MCIRDRALVWVKEVFPRLNGFIERRVSKTYGVVISWVLIAFMLANSLVSGAAVLRQSQRYEGVPDVYKRQALLGTAVFFALHSLVFLTAFYVGKWFPPRKRVDYIVVLGSGLIDGKVPPLLAGRVDAALRYAARQKRKTGREPCLIMSGVVSYTHLPHGSPRGRCHRSRRGAGLP